jgi:phenylpropionate dioxygenase-like ring-hydroxylating dioxygenase large terminal subunit
MFLALTQDLPKDKIIPLAQYDNATSIVNADKCYLISNICPHQNSKLTKCITETLTCPYHGMTFDIIGRGVNNNFTLAQGKVYQNQTILFDDHVDQLFPIDTQFMTLAEYRTDTVHASVDIIMDVFVDIEHIPVAHPGVYNQVGIDGIENISWSTFSNGSIQFVQASRLDHMIESDIQYNLGAVWLAIYTGTMIEWQPGALFVTVARKEGSTSCVHVFKYKDTRYSELSWATNESVWEQAWAQDKKLAEGISSLSFDNIDALKKHHRNWIKNAM